MLKLARAVLTIFSVILSAKYFGTSLERDTWIIAGSAVTVITQILFGPINEIFRTKFIHVKGEEGKSAALASANSLFYAIVWISLFFIGVVEFFPESLSGLFAPGFVGAQQQMLSLMIRWIIPTLLINEITLIMVAILNSYQSYFIPDIYSLVSIIINIVSIVILAPFIGIYSLVISNYIGTAILGFILFRALSKIEEPFLKLARPKWSLIKPFLIASSPFYIAFIVGNAQTTVERILCTYLGVGNVSVLDYARKFIDMPISVIVGVITTILAPTLASLFITDKDNDFHREMIKFLRMLILGLVPFVACFSICSNELVELLLVRGSFNRQFSAITSQSLSIFFIGSVGYIMFAVGGQSLIAQKKATYYAMIGSIATAVSIVLNLLLIDSVGLIIFPLSWGGTLFIAGVFMMLLQKYNRIEVIEEISKMLCLLLLVIAINYCLRKFSLNLLFERVIDVKLHDLLVLITTVILGNISYIIIIFVLNMEEIHGLKLYLNRRFNAHT